MLVPSTHWVNEVLPELLACCMGRSLHVLGLHLRPHADHWLSVKNIVLQCCRSVACIVATMQSLHGRWPTAAAPRTHCVPILRSLAISHQLGAS